MRPGVRIHLLLVGLVLAAAPAAAQDNLHRGKTPQQVFSTDCAICHDKVRGLGAAMGAWQLSLFLADHYTTSKAVAASLTSYLMSIRRVEPERPQRRRTRPGNWEKQKPN
jgi:mono/diheme cytochrome c family protein